MLIEWMMEEGEVILGYVDSGMFSCVATCEIMCFSSFEPMILTFRLNKMKLPFFIGKSDH